MSERLKRLEAENVRLEQELDDALGMIDDLERGDGARAAAQAAEQRSNQFEAENRRLEIANERFKEELESAAEKALAVEKELALLAGERDTAEAALERLRRDLAAKEREFEKCGTQGARWERRRAALRLTRINLPPPTL